MMGLFFDASFGRLFIVTFTGKVSDEEYEGYLKKCDQVLIERPGPYALVYDARGYRVMGPRSRQMQSAWINRNRATIRKHCRGVAFILETSFKRGVLTAAHMVSPPPYRFKIFDTLEKGQAWCAESLGGADLPTLPPPSDQQHSGFKQILKPPPPGQVSEPAPPRISFTQRLDLRARAAPLVSHPRKSWK